MACQPQGWPVFTVPQPGAQLAPHVERATNEEAGARIATEQFYVARRAAANLHLESSPRSRLTPVTDWLKIGDLATRSGISRDTIRFYERSGLLPRPRRTPSGHRRYDERAVRQILFIRRSQGLGLTLDDIRRLMRVRDFQSVASYRVVAEVLRQRLDAVEERIAVMDEHRKRLVEALGRSTGPRPETFPAILELALEDRPLRRKEA